MKTRIAKFIADAGVASRRGGEELITAGRVAINGVVIDGPVHFVDENDVVTIDGKQIHAQTETKLYAFHKPLNTMTTARDPAGRKTIYDVLGDEYKHLRYVGRLDYKTTGLLLLTNDGDLARKLTMPSSHVSRTYIATVGISNATDLDAARHGMTVDGVEYRPMKIDVISRDKNSAQLRITIHEGKKNEVRIAMRACRAPVRKLHRISFGGIELGNLSVGEIRAIPQKTIDAMIKSL